MNSHKNAKLTARGREEMIRRMSEKPAAAVAAGFGVSLRTARKWMSRYRQGGFENLADRSSRPKRCRGTLTEQDFGSILALRKERLTGDEIALRLGLCRSSVFRALRKLGCSRISSWRKKRPSSVTSGKSPGKCCIWISSDWARLTALATRKQEHGKSVAATQAGNTYTSAWMMRPGQRIQRCSRMRPRNQR